MSTNAGLDLRRGRPLPAIGTTEAKLQQRKLDALRRGVHRISDVSKLPFGIHLIGVGGTGARVVESFIRSAPADLLDAPGSRFSALAVDIGDEDLKGLRAMSLPFREDRSQLDAISLGLPTMTELQASLSNYIDFLKLEYPLYHPNLDSTAWLSPDVALLDSEGSVPRAVAKAIYGRAFYDDGRPMHKALKRFAASVEATGGDSLVCVVFGLGGGTGSGIALDLARHLSSGLFGRRVLVTGVGVAPHIDDSSAARGAKLYTTLSELDVLCDETKNRGVTVSCGELYRNPFTAGFIVVPQHPTMNKEASRKLVDEQLAKLFAERRGANIWEALRLLNWVAAPSTQHSAARTPWGARWLHLFGFGSDEAFPPAVDLRGELGLLNDYRPEFLEFRTAEGSNSGVAAAWMSALDSSLSPETPTVQVTGTSPGCVQYLLPRMALTDLSMFRHARDAYDAQPLAARRALHALLLEQGLILCEPSTKFEGMAGASLGSGGQWIAVPIGQLRGEAE